MTTYNTETSWGSVSKSFHWLLFVLVTTQLSIGIYTDTLDTDIPAQFELSLAIWPFHEGIGLTIFPVAAAAFIWRLRNTRPKYVPMPRWQQIASRAVQELIYVIIIILPLVGFVQTQAYGFPVTYFNLFTFPKLFEKSDALEQAMHNVHETLGWTLAVLLVVHTAAAVKHHVIDKDETLKRMLPESW